MLSAKHVRDGYVAPEGAGLISESSFRKALERCAPTKGDILVVSVGATTGRSAIVEGSDPFAIVRSVLMLRPLIPSRFLLHWLQTAWAFQWMTQASGASAQPHLYIRDIKRLPVPVPPLAEQLEMVRQTDELLTLADSLRTRLETVERRIERSSQAVLAKAFRGELAFSPNSTNGEPA
jgi:type I restriction enzyme S subunit